MEVQLNIVFEHGLALKNTQPFSICAKLFFNNQGIIMPLLGEKGRLVHRYTVIPYSFRHTGMLVIPIRTENAVSRSALINLMSMTNRSTESTNLLL